MFQRKDREKKSQVLSIISTANIILVSKLVPQICHKVKYLLDQTNFKSPTRNSEKENSICQIIAVEILIST